MTLPQELIDMILFKFKGLEHPTAKVMKEEYADYDLDFWKEDYDLINKQYFNDIWDNKLSGDTCSCGNDHLTNGDWCNKKSNGEVFGCWKCSQYLSPEEIQEIEEEEEKEYIKEFERMRLLSKTDEEMNATKCCCWCGYDETKYYVPPYGMVCGEMCASMVSIVKKVRFWTNEIVVKMKN